MASEGSRPDGKPAEQGAGQFDPTRLAPDRKVSEAPEENKRFGKPEGHPIDKATPKPRTRLGDKGILEGERSDREAGRPIQLEDDDNVETQPGRADAEPGLGGRQQAGRQDRRSGEVEPTKR